MKVALAQMNPEWEDKHANKKICESLVAAAARAKADAVVFPEMTLTGFTMRSRAFGESEKKSETVVFFSSLAKKYGVAIVFGVIFQDSKKGKNMAVVVNKRGRVLCRYQKIHPFSFAHEEQYYSAGRKLGGFVLGGWKAAVVVCYDLRFGGLFEAIAAKKPDVIFVIANWPDKRKKHWKTLLRARALDTQAFVVGVNRVGSGGGLSYAGKSKVYGPDATMLLTAASKEGVSLVTLDKNELKRWRKQFPSLRDKRPSVYRTL